MFLYDDIDIEKDWTPIEPIVKQIQVGKTQNHLVIRTLFPIQLVARTIHKHQGLSLNEMAFELTHVIKHGLIYIILSYV